MRHTPHFLLEDVVEVKRLIRENPWATMVSSAADGIVASHYPVVLEETADDEISIVSHVGRPDEVAHELGQREILVVIQGPHGYISPSWALSAGIATGGIVPTWNHVTAHLYGTPEILTDDENFRVLGELVDHFEKRMPEPTSLTLDEEGSRRVAKGTVGIRIPVARFDARLKLSQNKPSAVVDRIIDALENGDVYGNAALAAEMRRVRDR